MLGEMLSWCERLIVVAELRDAGNNRPWCERLIVVVLRAG